MKTYLVGGAVRDELLGRPIKERDFVVVGATPKEMLAKGFMRVGASFPVFLHPETKEEYALARTERKTGSGHRGFDVQTSPAVTLEEDLQRRDLTINAMARDDEGRLIDPCDGRQDLENRVLRHVSPSFAEDPLRVLRVARFAARFADLDFRVAGETLELMRSMVKAGEVDMLVPERVWQELVKALNEDRPSVFFRVLDECGAMVRLFPEINIGGRALKALDTAATLTADPEVRFAALTHELGPIPKSTDSLCDRLKSPRRFGDLAKLVSRYHDRAYKARDLGDKSILKLLLDTDALRRPKRFEQFLLASTAIYRSREEVLENDYPQIALLRQALAAVQEVKMGNLGAGKQNPKEVQRQVRRRWLEAIRMMLGSGI